MPSKSESASTKRKRAPSTTDSAPTTFSPRPSKTSKPSLLPPVFLSLLTVHKALNLISTFMATRKHTAPTFPVLQSAISKQLGRPVAVEEVARMVAVRPEGFTFEYVDRAVLRTLDLDAFEGMVVQGAPREASWVRTDGVDRGGEVKKEGVKVKEKEEDGDMEEGYVLYFEFVDSGKGDGKRKMTELKPGSGAGRSKRRPKDDGKAPMVNHKKLMATINKRNEAYEKALHKFISTAEAKSKNPVATLDNLSASYIPKPPVISAPVLKTEPDIPTHLPSTRPPFSELIETLKTLSFYKDQIPPNGHWTTPSTPPLYAPLSFLLSQRLVNALYNARNIITFYTHQSAALNALNSGHNVLLATPTASGKSLVFQLPVLRALEADPEARALFLFPTKALTQDQVGSLREVLRWMEGMEGVRVACFDGDTPGWEREGVRREARVLFTNPDMVHGGILPRHAEWEHVIRNLKFLVVDELHYYNGRIGAHLAYIMRRLRRLCAFYDTPFPLIITCTATISRPLPHFHRLFSAPATLISDSGAPTPLRHHLCWNMQSPLLAPVSAEDPRFVVQEVARLFTALILRGARVLAFCLTRIQCEMLTNAVHTSLHSAGNGDLAPLVTSYRGGYTPQDRRAIEADMAANRLRGFIATSALELGIDIGSLDCVISWSFPPSGITSWRQQIGRAGRRGGDALAILVADKKARDQVYMEEPTLLQSTAAAEMWSDLFNREIREAHLNCAAFELPIRLDNPLDADLFGPDLAGFLRPDGGLIPPLAEDRFHPGTFHAREVFRPVPARRVNIREIDDDMVAVVDLSNGRFALLEEMELGRATFSLFVGAVYLHQGRVYKVREYNAKERIAKVEFVKVGFADA